MKQNVFGCWHDGSLVVVEIDVSVLIWRTNKESGKEERMARDYKRKQA